MMIYTISFFCLTFPKSRLFFTKILSRTRSIANNSHDDMIMIRISDAGDDEHPNSGYLVVEKIDYQGAIRTITNGINGIFNAKWGIQI